MAIEQLKYAQGALAALAHTVELRGMADWNLSSVNASATKTSLRMTKHEDRYRIEAEFDDDTYDRRLEEGSLVGFRAAQVVRCWPEPEATLLQQLRVPWWRGDVDGLVLRAEARDASLTSWGRRVYRRAVHCERCGGILPKAGLRASAELVCQQEAGCFRPLHEFFQGDREERKLRRKVNRVVEEFVNLHADYAATWEITKNPIAAPCTIREAGGGEFKVGEAFAPAFWFHTIRAILENKNSSGPKTAAKRLAAIMKRLLARPEGYEASYVGVCLMMPGDGFENEGRALATRKVPR